MISGASEQELELATVIADKLLLQKENQELKKQLQIKHDGFMASTDELCEYAVENDKLKKQLEVSNELVAQGTLTEMKLRNEVNRWRKEYQDTYKDVRIEIKEYKTQQKEFIKWLEDYLDLFDNMNIGEQASYDMLEEILQKYKSIIGDKQ